MAESSGPPVGPVTVPCPVLVGRSSELDALRAALERARGGEGAVVFVFGEPGIGKSRLAHEIATIAAHSGVRVLRGRAVPGSSSAAFRPLTDALGPVSTEVDAAGGLAPWIPALAPILPTVAAAGAVEVTAPARGEAVLRLLDAVCAPHGGLLVLEDLHWADLETVAVVEHLSDNLHRAPILCVVTVRDEDSAARDLVKRVAARRTAAVLELGRLNEAQVAAMVFSCTGASDTGAVDRAVSMADGVPFLVEETLASRGVPETFADSVRSRLTALSEVDRRVLVTAAAFGRDFDWRLLARATGVDEVDAVEALERGVAEQLLTVDGDRFRFRHALSAEAVFESLSPPRREACAAAALAALEEVHGDVPPPLREVAAHVAERAGRRERAGQLRLALGEEALERGALGTAVAALQRAALDLAGGGQEDVALEQLVDALVLAGHVDDALFTGAALTARLPGPRAAKVHLRLAGAAATAARWGVADSHLAAAAGLVQEGASPSLAVELAVREAELALGTDDTSRAEERARKALDAARAAELPDAECEALQLLGRAARRRSLTAAEEWFREALAAAEAHDLPVWRLRAMHELGTIGLLERSEVHALVEAQELAESWGAVAAAAVLDIEIAAGRAGVDDFGALVRHGEQAVRRGSALGLDLVVAYGWMHVGVGAAMRGDREMAASAWASAREAAPGNRDVEGLVAGGELFAALAADDLDRALEHASRMTDLLRGSESAPPGHHRAAWPLLLAVAGRPEAAEAAEEIEREGLEVNRGARGWLSMARAVIAGRTDTEQAAMLALAADAELVHMPMWRSLARRLAAQAAAADGWRFPSEWLPEAEACLSALGFAAPAGACRRLRRGVAEDLPREWARFGITRREAEVLRLVVDGLTNREIADRLHVSPRTVEKHVESLLRKTSSRSRTQLARLAATT